MSEEKYNWITLAGDFSERDNTLLFHSNKHINSENKQPTPSIGIIICNKSFSEGIISAEIGFKKITESSACEIIINYDIDKKTHVSAGLGFGSMYEIRSIDSEYKTKFHASLGTKDILKAGKKYDVKVNVFGSRVTLSVDGVKVLSTNLPFNLTQSQVGIYCLDEEDITISNFRVEVEKPKAFVVMQFSEPYNELYTDVIKKITNEFGIEAIRADETYSAGLIIADIIKYIEESKIIIADISSANPNVYYEVGYAHALNKPTILIAEKGVKLPFDVSPFRTLFYENSIRGKEKIEENLRKYIKSAL